MKIEEALSTRKQEIESLDVDIHSLEEQAKNLKPTVQKYRRLKKKAKELKAQKEEKLLYYNNVLGFFKDVDDNYLNKIYPLFADLKIEEAEETKTESAA